MSRVLTRAWPINLALLGMTVGITAGLSGLQARADDMPVVAAADIKLPLLEGVVNGLSKDLSAPATATEPTSIEAPKPTEPQQAETAAPVAPVFELAAEISERLGREKSGAAEREDRNAATKFYEARAGAPVWLTEAGVTRAAQALTAEIGKAADYGLSADAFKLPLPVAAGSSRADLADAEVSLTLAALKYARHARGGRMDPQALSSAIDRKAQLLPPTKVLAELAQSDKPDAKLRGFHAQHPQFEKLRQKYLALKAGQPVLDAPAPVPETVKGKQKQAVAKVISSAALERKLLVNMEMWRWMPAFGKYYIQANIPDFTVRVVKDGQVIHSERIVTGKAATMTPQFSDEMRLIVFKPFWNVPDSIKFKELQPQLVNSGAALTRAGLRAEINGRPVDPASVDWLDVDMRQVHIFQPPGEANALGRVKFLFPNKHDVYLHDTPSKSLFNATDRAFSHGCVRVRDPLKLAEIILGADKGMTRAQINQLAQSGPDNNEIKLSQPIPIHLTYFTAWVDDNGKLQTAADVYGHEPRVQLGIEGKANLIAQPREERYAPPTAEERRRFAQQRQPQSTPVEKWFKDVFNF